MAGTLALIGFLYLVLGTFTGFLNTSTLETATIEELMDHARSKLLSSFAGGAVEVEEKEVSEIWLVRGCFEDVTGRGATVGAPWLVVAGLREKCEIRSGFTIKKKKDFLLNIYL